MSNEPQHQDDLAGDDPFGSAGEYAAALEEGWLDADTKAEEPAASELTESLQTLNNTLKHAFDSEESAQAELAERDRDDQYEDALGLVETNPMEALKLARDAGLDNERLVDVFESAPPEIQELFLVLEEASLRAADEADRAARMEAAAQQQAETDRVMGEFNQGFVAQNPAVRDPALAGLTLMLLNRIQQNVPVETAEEAQHAAALAFRGAREITRAQANAEWMAEWDRIDHDQSGFLAPSGTWEAWSDAHQEAAIARNMAKSISPERIGATPKTAEQRSAELHEQLFGGEEAIRAAGWAEWEVPAHRQVMEIQEARVKAKRRGA